MLSQIRKHIAEKRASSKKFYPKRPFRVQYYFVISILIWFPMIISYSVFIQDKVVTMQDKIKENLVQAAMMISQTQLVQEKLFERTNDYSLQHYASLLLNDWKDVDLIVIADQEGEKYSHLDEKQIGQIFIGEDKMQVLEEGISYYSIKQGSMGITFRYFMPILYENQQVGFVMVGKYVEAIDALTYNIKQTYLLLFMGIIIVTYFIAIYFERYLTRIILNMEPQEIAELYLQKNSIFNTVQEGMILFDAEHHIQDENDKAAQLLAYFPLEPLMQALREKLEMKEAVRMQEMIIEDQKVFINVEPIIKEEIYFGAVVTLMDQAEISSVAKEITGIEEVNKQLRASVHEFKNQLHVILGLIQLEAYKEAEDYILKIQHTKAKRIQTFAQIKDPFVNALLMSRFIVADEKRVKIRLASDANLWEAHGRIEENDLITVLGNLIENALEACSRDERADRLVEIFLREDEKGICVQVRDNGPPIASAVKGHLYEMGKTTKGSGRGTGLYLVKRRTMIYGGSIELVEQAEGKIFSVWLPKGEGK